MKLFPTCAGECAICGYADFCLAGNGDDDYCLASKEEVIERLLQDRYPGYRDVMLDYLLRRYNYVFDPARIGAVPKEPRHMEPPTDEEVNVLISRIFGEEEPK